MKMILSVKDGDITMKRAKKMLEANAGLVEDVNESFCEQHNQTLYGYACTKLEKHLVNDFHKLQLESINDIQYVVDEDYYILEVIKVD